MHARITQFGVFVYLIYGSTRARVMSRVFVHLCVFRVENVSVCILPCSQRSSELSDVTQMRTNIAPTSSSVASRAHKFYWPHPDDEAIAILRTLAAAVTYRKLHSRIHTQIHSAGAQRDNAAAAAASEAE